MSHDLGMDINTFRRYESFLVQHFPLKSRHALRVKTDIEEAAHLASVRADPRVKRPRGWMLLNSYDVLEGSMRQRS
eukprot:1121061-Amphidinium_carterae.1